MSVLCIRGIVSVDEAAYTVSIREKEGIQMKKQFAALAGICCLILLLCSCAPKQNAVEEPTDNSNTTQVVPRSDSADSEDSEENTPAPESEAPRTAVQKMMVVPEWRNIPLRPMCFLSKVTPCM